MLCPFILLWLICSDGRARWLVAGEVQPRKSLVRLIECLLWESEISAKVPLTILSYIPYSNPLHILSSDFIILPNNMRQRAQCSIFIKSNTPMLLRDKHNSRNHYILTLSCSFRLIYTSCMLNSFPDTSVCVYRGCIYTWAALWSKLLTIRKQSDFVNTDR